MFQDELNYYMLQLHSYGDTSANIYITRG